MAIVAVTGATGKSGQWFIKRLMREAEGLSAHTFRFLVRDRAASRKNAQGHALIEALANCPGIHMEQHVGSLADAGALAAFIGGGCTTRPAADILLHIAGIEWSKQAVEAALAGGVKHLILVHTTGIYTKHKAEGEGYRQIEAAVEAMLKAYRDGGGTVTRTILRPTMIYGNLEDRNISVFIRMVDALRVFPVVNGARYALQPVWCKDLGEAYLDVIRNMARTAGRDYVLSGGRPITLRDMLREIARQLGVRNVFVTCPFWVAYGGAWCLYAVSLRKIDCRERVQRLVEPRVYSHDDAARDFGYEPVPFEVGIKDEIAMFLEAKQARQR